MEPYMGTGTPLAADTGYSVFSPMRILDMFANTYDIVVLLRIWIAGAFMALFLKELRLGRASALAGAVSICSPGPSLGITECPGLTFQCSRRCSCTT